MRNAGLEEAQAGIKIAGRNISNLRYADDTTLMAESEEELKSLLMKVKVKSEKVDLKLNPAERLLWPGRASPSASQLLAFSPGKEQAAGRVAFEEVSGHRVLIKSGLENRSR